MTVRDSRKMKNMKRRLILIDPFCVYCRRPLSYDHPTLGLVPHNKYATIDHLLPADQGGDDDPENCVLACHACNNSKGNRTPREWADMIVRAADALEERVNSVRFWTLGQAAKPAGLVECMSD